MKRSLLVVLKEQKNLDKKIESDERGFQKSTVVS
jgi:hypothetical protein